MRQLLAMQNGTLAAGQCWQIARGFSNDSSAACVGMSSVLQAKQEVCQACITRAMQSPNQSSAVCWATAQAECQPQSCRKVHLPVPIPRPVSSCQACILRGRQLLRALHLPRVLRCSPPGEATVWTESGLVSYTPHALLIPAGCRILVVLLTHLL